MSTKELYEAHALIAKNNAADQFAYNLVDAVIEKYIEAEQYMQIHLKTASIRLQKSVDQIYRERFSAVICRLAVNPSKDIPAIPDGSEMEQLQFLADHHGCPRATWQ
jgi:polyphosphate kinase